MNYGFEGMKFKREQQIIDLKERIDKFYSPLFFHLQNMRSWAKFLKKTKKYAWADKTLEEKIADMNVLMRNGLRFASRRVEELWYEWQPLAVVMLRPKDYPQHFDIKEFYNRCEKLDEALRSDKEELMKLYDEGIGKRKKWKFF